MHIIWYVQHCVILWPRGVTKPYQLVISSLNHCSCCRIGHDNKGGFAGWFLDKVIIDVPSLGQKAVFPCGRWLDKGKDDGQLERELFPGVDTEEAYSPCKEITSCRPIYYPTCVTSPIVKPYYVTSLHSSSHSRLLRHANQHDMTKCHAGSLVTKSHCVE